MGRKTPNISLIQIDENLISRLQIAASGKQPVVESFDQIRGDWATSAEAKQAALATFATDHALAEDTIITVLPRHRITTRILDVPSQDYAEIESMVRLSAEEFVPFPSTEMVIDHAVLKHSNAGESTVLVALAHQDVVHNHLALLKHAGLEPTHIYLSTACLVTAAVRAPGEKPDRYALVNLAAGGLEVLVMESGQLVLDRGVALTLDWEAGADAMGVLGGGFDELTMEVRTSLGTHRRDSSHGESVEQIFVCSDYADVDKAVRELKQDLNKETQSASFINGGVASGAEHLTCVPAALLGAAWTVLGRAPVVIDLIPGDLVEARKSQDSRKRVLKLILAALIVLAGLGVCYGQMVYQRTQYLQELQQQLSLLGPDAQAIMAKQKQLSIIRRRVDRNGSILEILGTISEAAPKGKVNITRMSYTRNEGVDIWGRAKSVDDVHKFTDQLRGMASSQLAMFAHAANAYSSKAKELDKDIYQYKIEMSIPEVDGDE